MEKTGERYAAARAALLSAEETRATEGPTLTMSEESILRRTGRGWEEWFDLLDQSGAAAWPHVEIARWLAAEQGIDGWDAQSVTVSYERARAGRAVGERPDGFSVTASRAVAVPVERLYDAFVDEAIALTCSCTCHSPCFQPPLPPVVASARQGEWRQGAPRTDGEELPEAPRQERPDVQLGCLPPRNTFSQVDPR